MLKYNFVRNYGMAPEVAHPGEDIGYDLFSPYTIDLAGGNTAHIPTGIAIEFDPPAGALIMARSSMAKQQVIVIGGVIDAGYRGELLVMLHNLGSATVSISEGQKFAQLIEMPKLATQPERAIALSASLREERGFGSTGK